MSMTNPGAASHTALIERVKAILLKPKEEWVKIEAEPATAILSDDGIAEILRGEGIEIARRTVAKYRESLRIPSSSQRRRARALHLR